MNLLAGSPPPSSEYGGDVDVASPAPPLPDSAEMYRRSDRFDLHRGLSQYDDLVHRSANGAYVESIKKSRVAILDKPRRYTQAVVPQKFAPAYSDIKGKNAGNVAYPRRTLVSYAYIDKDPRLEGHVQRNLQFFLSVGVREHDDVDYVFVINNFECSVDIPQYKNVFIIGQANTPTDFGAHTKAIAFMAEYHDTKSYHDLPYDYFVFLNCGVRGPFLPVYWPHTMHWTRVFTDRITDRVKAVGTVIACIDEPWNDHVGPRVESFAYAIDRVALDILIRRGALARHQTKVDAILHGEYMIGKSILEAGYTIDSLLYRYRDVDWTDKRNWKCNENKHATRTGEYGGISVHPFEVVFHKSLWFKQDVLAWIRGQTRVAGDHEDKYTQWMMDWFLS
eukprot:TRINITY_DN57944_c0_g1_i1.p2 TRINITY_DN57944_c0_g1~~TRINITY_DN57944_c0_g1_i1.p2  ORF type:complete len:392 (+),score=164.98 TRINITY_DN57944_c0_g1_i1:83-1258(+)